MRDVAAELTVDLIKSRGPALILDGVMEERCNRFVFASTVLEYE
jgi:hypothetical protein